MTESEEKKPKAKKIPVKEKTLDEARTLIMEMRKNNDDWYNRKVIAKAHKLLTGSKKNKNIDVNKSV